MSAQRFERRVPLATSSFAERNTAHTLMAKPKSFSLSSLVQLEAFLVLITAAAVAGAPVTSSKSTSKSPHLILLVLDDLGWADVGYHGSDFATPNIDALVSSGIELDRMYAMPQCSPTRASLLTGRCVWPAAHAYVAVQKCPVGVNERLLGRFAWNIGMQHFNTIFPGSSAGVPKESPMLPEELKRAGYAPHAIGKW